MGTGVSGRCGWLWVVRTAGAHGLGSFLLLFMSRKWCHGLAQGSNVDEVKESGRNSKNESVVGLRGETLIFVLDEEMRGRDMALSGPAQREVLFFLCKKLRAVPLLSPVVCFSV